MTIDDIALTLQRGLGPKGTAYLLDIMGSAEAIYSAGEEELVTRCELRRDIAHDIAAKSTHRQAEDEARYIYRYGISAIASTDPEYPPLLRECSDYPHVLYFMGDAAAFEGRAVAMVGTRRATQYGQRMCDRLVCRLSELEPCIVPVSGLAYGIDAAVARAALQHGLRTVAVIANPLPDITPAQHRDLSRDIIAHGGAIVTELHSQTKQNGSLFIPRNRIIAGMSEGTVVIETPLKGGSLSTASFADSYGRAVMAVPGRADDKFSAGANALITERRAAMVCTGDDIARELGWHISVPGIIPEREPAQTPVTSDEQTLLSCIGAGESPDMETLSERSQIPAGQLAALLLELELAGLIRKLPGQRYERV